MGLTAFDSAYEDGRGFQPAQVQEQFLATFPHSETFVQGVVRLKGGNGTYHLTPILALTEVYPPVRVQAALQRATEYGAFTAKHVRNICQSEAALNLIPQSTVPVSPPSIRFQEAVEQRPLAQYAEVAR